MDSPTGGAEDLLRRLGQGHLLEDLEDSAKARLLAQASHLDSTYSGGLQAYVENARRLLHASRRGDNPFDACTPSVPTGERVVIGDERHAQLEALGLRNLRQSAFVLVAGGLGERLGFSGIKLALPVTVLTGWTYLEFFCRSIRAFQSAQLPVAGEDEDGSAPPDIPLVIMTSGDTHDKTVAMLNDGSYFGLKEEQVHVLMQEKVACLSDSEAHLARDSDGMIETKPHGHGDVHSLLHSSGLAARFLSEGRKWLFFFQDTNSLVFKIAAATVGVSAELGFAMNSVSVPRRPKDAMGGITRLTREDGSSITVNVEYNQLDPMLRSTTTYPDGDAADETGYSPFPGNMNTLALELSNYVATLKRTSGIIAEFVNPKYADGSRTSFKSSTRLECMMQDIPKEFPPEASVGFSCFESWIAYAPVKNNPEAAAKAFKNGNVPQSGTTGETDLFAANCRLLRLAGAEIEAPKKATFNSIDVNLEARVVWSPEWAASLQAVRRRLVGKARVQISQRSTLILDGDIFLEDLCLDGTLSIFAAPGCRVVVRKLALVTDAWELTPQLAGEGDEISRIRGFTVTKPGPSASRPAREMCFTTPGEHIIEEEV